MMQKIEKSHTCEEGGAHLRISFWHLLMNLKNNYLLKNCTSRPAKKKNYNIYNVIYIFFLKKRKTPGNTIILHLFS